jgi:hypothetical protein
LQEQAVRLGTWLPFRPAAALLAECTGTGVDEATVRRRTEAAGAAYVAVQTAAVAALERDAPAPAPGPATQLVRVDGAMVPLVGGTWAEVKTLAVGTVRPPVDERGAPTIHTAARSYFSRRAEAADFTRLALAETHRRGVASAGRVAGVVDGAEWAQRFLDYHRPDAVRILDFPHAAEYVAAAGRAAGGDAATADWLTTQLHELRHGAPTTVLAALLELRRDLGDRPEALATVARSVQYRETRRDQIAYAAFTAAGLPVGSGSVERANKLVVEVRLKGGGRPWAPAHVNPMVALRTAVCHDRWAEAWPQIAAELRGAARQRGRQRRQRRHLAVVAPQAAPAPPALPAVPPPLPAVPPPLPVAPPRPPRREPAPGAPRRPAPGHPWRRYGLPLNPRAA